ncbi:LOW QUALITY PROTEIN: hypothetical protein Cgig2_013942 [Carnegiea gigantea]|uniref:Uncharacterized protein n=1 Tax=Carnegiea gigantea TaxID=171969 RepID=A0A9Q1GX09_9CARY|nr:LOW QUALITY PROTEIN: hypothetical protein Cgig2_013942 [Carnegiea gigantea]
MDQPPAHQFVTTEQLREAPKQVQEEPTASPSPSEGLNTNQHQVTSLYTCKFEVDAPNGIRALCKAKMLGESSKLSNLSRKPTVVSLSRSPPQLRMHPRVVKPGGIRSRGVLSPPLLDKGRFQKMSSFASQDPEETKDNDANRDMEIIVTIIGGIDDKPESLKPLMGSTMTFDPEDIRPFPHNGALVIQVNIATAMLRRILVDTRSSIDIITLECLTKLQYKKKDLEAVETPVVGFRGQATECYYMSLKSLGIKERDPIGETSRLNKTGKKTEEHGRPYLEPTSEVVPVPLDPNCPERII